MKHNISERDYLMKYYRYAHEFLRRSATYTGTRGEFIQLKEECYPQIEDGKKATFTITLDMSEPFGLFETDLAELKHQALCMYQMQGLMTAVATERNHSKQFSAWDNYLQAYDLYTGRIGFTSQVDTTTGQNQVKQHGSPIPLQKAEIARIMNVPGEPKDANKQVSRWIENAKALIKSAEKGMFPNT